MESQYGRLGELKHSVSELLTETMALQPLALHLLGVELPSQRRNERRRDESGANGQADGRPPRAPRRATSYYNPFQTTCTTATDNPPCYAIATRHKPAERRPEDCGKECLPQYTCTVAAEAKVLLNIESVSPLHGVAASEWREAYMVLRGTLLSFHKPKDGGPGRLLRSYTLQHAEVGLAPDVEYSTLEPKTKLAHMIPTAARRRAWLKDPSLFEVLPQHAMRLRLETDQIVLASPLEEQIHNLISAVSAGIDLSCPIDERNIPRQCTVPRRRRRHRREQPTAANLEDPTLLAEQERILRDIYPGFAERAEDQPRLELGRTITTITAGSAISANEALPTPAREEDEIDLSVIREDDDAPSSLQVPSPRRPNFMRSITDTSVNTNFSGEMLYATSPDNFSVDTGKWQPPHSRTPEQIRRYVKRCLPVLPAEAARASDILICNGKRVRVNLRMEMLEAWELYPPSYKSHGFAKARNDAVRPQSIAGSGVTPETENNAQTSTSVLGVENEDQITRADENALANLEFAKVTSLSATGKGSAIATREVARAAKRLERRDPGVDMHGVVFCF